MVRLPLLLCLSLLATAADAARIYCILYPWCSVELAVERIRDLESCLELAACSFKGVRFIISIWSMIPA